MKFGTKLSTFRFPLADVAAESSTDSDERAIDITRSAAHSRGRRQGNKGNDQQILDQSLATFVVLKISHQTGDSFHFFSLNFAIANRVLRFGGFRFSTR